MSKYNKEILQEAVDNSESIYGVLRHLGLKQAGGNHSHIKSRIELLEIDTSHFLGMGHQKGKSCNSGNKKSADDILIQLPEGSNRPKLNQLRRALTDSDIKEICNKCGLSDLWNDLPIRMEIDHIDNNWLNNQLDNLQYLCPNCHYQKTWVKEFS